MGLLDHDPEAPLWPVLLPDGSVAFCPVDHAGRIDAREAYRPWTERTGGESLRRRLPPPRSARQ